MEENETVDEAQNSTENVDEEKVKYLNKIYRKIKRVELGVKIFAGAWVAILAALIVLIIVDNVTPKDVYLFAFMLWSAAAVLTAFLVKRYVKRLQRKTEQRFNLPEDALIGGKKTDKEALKPKADNKKIKDKVYYVLTGIALLGDALTVVGIALIASKANVPAAVAVICVFVGAPVLFVFHIVATTRYFNRKAKAEQKTVPLTGIQNKK